ncbi:MAG: hypothetical protein OEY28_03660, partial [Nitrospira sp.]|nr:hypothetical protein [Nitrospira sp.]
MTLRNRESAGGDQIAPGRAGTKNQPQRAARVGAGKTAAQVYAGRPVQAKTSAVAATVANTPNATTPPLTFEPFQLDFEQHAIGATSPSRHALLRNYGEWPVTVPNLALDGQASNDFILATRGPLLVEPGDFATVELSFAPSAPGSRSAALTAPGDDELGATLLVLGFGAKADEVQPAGDKTAAADSDAGTGPQPAQQPASQPQDDTDASALASIQVVTRTKHVLMLEPWRISEKHKKNSQPKKRFYKRLDKAKRALRVAEQTFQAAAAGTAKEKALQGFQTASAEAEAATIAFRDHVIAAY